MTGAEGRGGPMALIGDLGAHMRLPGRLARLPRRIGERLSPAFKAGLPKGLYARSILIVVMPIVILQTVVAYVFMERHWELVTRRLSNALTRDIAAIIDVIETYPQDARFSEITRLAADALGLTISVLPPGPLPDP